MSADSKARNVIEAVGSKAVAVFSYAGGMALLLGSAWGWLHRMIFF